jgi:hypothetical protein
MKRTCPECGEEYTGRSDKKFCSANCRATHHNRANAEERGFQRAINNILRHNRNVLAELNPNGKANVKKERLIDRGFKFRYYTNEYRSRSGVLYHFCYDYGYKVEEGDWVLVIKRQEYVE